MSRRPTFTLYTSARCPYAARVRIVLAEKNVPHTSIEIELSDRPAYMWDKNPTGTVPVLEHGDEFVLPESRAIMEYLEERFSSPSLLPDAPDDRAFVRLALDQFDRFSDAYYGWRYRGQPAENLHEELDRLNGRVAAAGYVAGSAYGLADIGYVPWVLRAQHRGVPMERYEAIVAWIDRLARRPPVAAEVAVVADIRNLKRDTADLGFWA